MTVLKIPVYTEERAREKDIVAIAKLRLLESNDTAPFVIEAQYARLWLEAIVRLGKRCDAMEAHDWCPEIDERPFAEIEAERLARLRNLLEMV